MEWPEEESFHVIGEDLLTSVIEMDQRYPPRFESDFKRFFPPHSDRTDHTPHTSTRSWHMVERYHVDPHDAISPRSMTTEDQEIQGDQLSPGVYILGSLVVTKVLHNSRPILKTATTRSWNFSVCNATSPPSNALYFLSMFTWTKICSSILCHVGREPTRWTWNCV